MIQKEGADNVVQPTLHQDLEGSALVIGAHEIERAEYTLRVIYGGASLDRQLSAFQIEREAFDNFLTHSMNVLKKRYGSSYQDMDPGLEPAWATMMVHMFMTGIIVGHNQIRGIE